MESPQNASVLRNIQNPFHQMILVLGSSLGIMLIGFLINIISSSTISPEFPWLTSASFILIFSVLTAIVALSSADIEIYFRHSIMAFIILVVGSGLMAFLFSGMGINAAGTYKYIYGILVIVYMALLSIGGLIKRISMALQREEDAYNAREGNQKN